MKPATSKMARKRKAKPETTSSEPKNIKLLETEVADPMSPPLCPLIKPKKGRKKKKLDSTEDIHDKLSDRFPILKNSDLVNKFMSVPLSNNQKGLCLPKLSGQAKLHFIMCNCKKNPVFHLMKLKF